MFPVLMLQGEYGFPYYHNPRSSVPHDAIAFTKHYLQESVEPRSEGHHACYLLLGVLGQRCGQGL